MPAAFLPRLAPLLLPLIFVNLTGHMALSGGRLSGSMFLLHSGEAESLVGLFMALFSVLPVLVSLSIGRWVDRAGAGPVLKAGVALVVVGAWLPALFLSFGAVLAMAMLIGFGFNMVSLAAQHTVGHLVPDAAPSQRLANFGWYALGHSASSTLGPFVAGIAIDLVGYRAAFVAMALFACTAALLVAGTTRRLPGVPRRPDTPAAASAGAAASRAHVPHLLDLLASPEMRRIYWTNAVTASAWDLFIVMLPVLGHRLGYSASLIGTVFSLFAIGTFGARAAMPWLSRRANEWQILRVAVCVVVLVYIALPFASMAWSLMLLGLVFGAAVGMSQPNILSLLHGAAPPGRGGEAVGLRAVLSNGCSVLVPLGFGAALLPLGIGSVLTIGATLFASGIWPTHRGALARQRPLPGRS